MPSEGANIPAWMAQQTFAIQHNPNCAKPFLVRLIKKGQSGLDLKPYAFGVETQDALGFGDTLEEASEAARLSQAATPKPEY